MTNNEKRFRQKVEKLTEVYVAKNKDYGDSFSQSLDKYGIIASLVRMGDKMNRIDSLYDKPTTEVDESLVDSLEDLANYAIMTAIWLEKQVEGEVDYTDSTFYVSDDPYFTIRKYSDGRTENITYFDDDDYDDHFNCRFDDECTHGDYFNFDDDDDDMERQPDWNDGWHDFDDNDFDDEPEDDPDDFIMDGLPKFRIVRRQKGGLSGKDYWDMIRDLFDEEGD